MEHLQEVIRMLVIAIILIFSIAMIFNLMSNMEATNEYRTNILKYNAVASKILYSSDCYALEQSYTSDGNTMHAVRAGILDSSKLVKGRLDACIDNGQSEVEIFNLDTERRFDDKTKCKGSDITERMFTLIDNNGKLERGIARIKVCV